MQISLKAETHAAASAARGPLAIACGLSIFAGKGAGALTSPISWTSRFNFVLRNQILRSIAMHLVSIDDAGSVSIDGERLPAHLTKHEAAFVRSLFSRPYATTKEQMLLDLYAGRDEPAAQILTIWACKSRRKLGSHPIIETVWGQGWKANPDYRLGASPGRATIEIESATRDLLDTVAFEADRLPNDLANELIRDGLKALRNRLWGRAA